MRCLHEFERVDSFLDVLEVKRKAAVGDNYTRLFRDKNGKGWLSDISCKRLSLQYRRNNKTGPHVLRFSCERSNNVS